MRFASDTVRAFLRSIDVRDDDVERGLAQISDLRVVQDLRFRVIAHAKAKDVTGERTYHEALRSLDALLKGGGRFKTEADGLLRTAASRYAALEAESEAAVVRWEWWTGDHYDLEPYRSERHRFSRGKKIAEPTTKKDRAGKEAYGFDAEGRVRVQRSYCEIGFSETFTTYDDGLIELRHYGNSGHEPINAVRYRLADGGAGPRIEERHFTAKHGASIERYAYDGERIVRISVQSSNQPPQELTCHHDALGNLERIDDVSALDAKFHRPLWERPKKGLSLAKLLPAIRTRFIELLVKELSTVELASPAYALAIVMDTDSYDHLLPPSFAIGTVVERDAVVARHGGRAYDHVWGTSEWKHSDLHVGDDGLAALVTPANQMLWTEEKYDLAMRLANDVAKELNGMPLPLERDPDFVVFACELDGKSGVAGIRKAAPAALRTRLAPLLGPVKRR